MKRNTFNSNEEEMIRRFLTCWAIGALMCSASLAQQKLSLTVDLAVQIGLESSKSLHTSQFKLNAAGAKASEPVVFGLV